MNDLNESELINVEPSEKRLKRIWNNSIKNGEITPATGKAIGIVLGGQPGSGKSVLTDNIKNQTPNVVVMFFWCKNVLYFTHNGSKRKEPINE